MGVVTQKEHGPHPLSCFPHSLQTMDHRKEFIDTDTVKAFSSNTAFMIIHLEVFTSFLEINLNPYKNPYNFTKISVYFDSAPSWDWVK